MKVELQNVIPSPWEVSAVQRSFCCSEKLTFKRWSVLNQYTDESVQCGKIKRWIRTEKALVSVDDLWMRGDQRWNILKPQPRFEKRSSGAQKLLIEMHREKLTQKSYSFAATGFWKTKVTNAVCYFCRFRVTSFWCEWQDQLNDHPIFFFKEPLTKILDGSNGAGSFEHKGSSVTRKITTNSLFMVFWHVGVDVANMSTTHKNINKQTYAKCKAVDWELNGK